MYRIINIPALNRIIVHIVQLLNHHILALYLLRMAALLPHPVFAITLVIFLVLLELVGST